MNLEQTPARSFAEPRRTFSLGGARQFVRRAIVLLLVAVTLFAAPSDAFAQKKKKKEDEQPTKSYVFPYFVVMMMVSLGLMTVCRPGKRKDKPDEIKEDLSQ